MNGTNRFDDISRILASRIPRRAAIKLIAGTIFGGAAATLSLSASAGTCRNKNFSSDWDQCKDVPQFGDANHRLVNYCCPTKAQCCGNGPGENPLFDGFAHCCDGWCCLDKCCTGNTPRCCRQSPSHKTACCGANDQCCYIHEMDGPYCCPQNTNCCGVNKAGNPECCSKPTPSCCFQEPNATGAIPYSAKCCGSPEACCKGLKFNGAIQTEVYCCEAPTTQCCFNVTGVSSCCLPKIERCCLDAHSNSPYCCPHDKFCCGFDSANMKQCCDDSTQVCCPSDKDAAVHKCCPKNKCCPKDPKLCCSADERCNPKTLMCEKPTDDD